jgi:prostaglandin-endoperoxide synthase 2
MPRLGTGGGPVQVILKLIPFFSAVLEFFPATLARVNRLIINYFASSSTPRPHPFSLWSPSRPATPAAERIPAARANVVPGPDPISPPARFTSWPSLVDRTFTARHLPPRDDVAALPSEAEVMQLFERRGPMKRNPRSSVLFCFFAQWFTDSFLRTHPLDARRNTSNHEIDMCQIYGLDEPSTWALRSGAGGRLKSRKGKADGCEYPVFLWKDGVINPDFYDPVNETGLTYLRAGRDKPWMDALETALKGTISDPARRDSLYASGLDRGSSTIAYSAFNTIFLREHNRIADSLAKANPKWEDDQLFETARLINIRQILNVVVNDYIRHIGGSFPFALDRTFAEGKRWYRTNRISIEFNLLYRWHSLVPDEFRLAGEVLENEQFRYNNALLERHGVERLFTDASSQRAGRVALRGFLSIRRRSTPSRCPEISGFSRSIAIANASGLHPTVPSTSSPTPTSQRRSNACTTTTWRPWSSLSGCSPRSAARTYACRRRSSGWSLMTRSRTS